MQALLGTRVLLWRLLRALLRRHSLLLRVLRIVIVRILRRWAALGSRLRRTAARLLLAAEHLHLARPQLLFILVFLLLVLIVRGTHLPHDPPQQQGTDQREQVDADEE